MSAAQIGGIIGAVLGLVSFIALRWVANRIESAGGAGQVQRSKAGNIIRIVAIVDMIAFTVVGYLLGPVVAGR